jgi:hypothetical protein
MPRRTDAANEEKQGEKLDIQPALKAEKEDEIENLNKMLGAVMRYISDDEIVEIDIEYLLDNTKGLRSWWNDFREKDRKRVEEDIKKSLSGLSLEELEKIHEQIQEKTK